MSELKKMTRAALILRVQELERHVVCADCGHLCGDHYEADSPCYGGRTPTMKPDEGEYCECSGFYSGVTPPPRTEQ